MRKQTITQNLKPIRFNPRTRVGCECIITSLRATVCVSIHAPVWGAKVLRFLDNHQPRFQSTHPCGVRRTSRWHESWLSSFNPRTRVGCEVLQLYILTILTFQSTHPCGVRRYNLPPSRVPICFTPRTRVGCEPIKPSYLMSEHVSIHAPVWGAKIMLTSQGHWMTVSIHAPVWGAKPINLSAVRYATVSIHAPVWGAKFSNEIIVILACFNPRTRVGCEDSDNGGGGGKLFQSTHPCGVRIKFW